MKTFRTRRDLLTQLYSIEYAVEKMTSEKGKHRDQFSKMPDDLQKQFGQFAKATRVLRTKYEAFLYERDDLKLSKEVKENMKSFKEFVK